MRFVASTADALIVHIYEGYTIIGGNFPIIGCDSFSCGVAVVQEGTRLRFPVKNNVDASKHIQWYRSFLLG